MPVFTKQPIESRCSRRHWIKSVGLGAAAAAMGASCPPGLARGSGGRKRLLRLAHITDIHAQPERGADEGLAACLRHIQGQTDKVDLILNTGDCVMDSSAKDEKRTRVQWEVWDRVLRSELRIPIEHCLGNHDVWGWNRKRSKTTGEEALWGKGLAMEVLGLKKSYRSFDRNGWHFIALDSVYPWRNSYKGRLDQKQFEWLERDLATVDPATPVLVMSHIPILSVAAFMSKDTEATGDFLLPGSLTHLDFRRIKDLFRQHPNVKVCISGHLHLLDEAKYLGVSYLCNGAVSGAWWKGMHMNECDAGYALVDLFDDGSCQRQYVTYGWAPRPEPGKTGQDA